MLYVRYSIRKKGFYLHGYGKKEIFLHELEEFYSVPGLLNEYVVNRSVLLEAIKKAKKVRKNKRIGLAGSSGLGRSGGNCSFGSGVGCGSWRGSCCGIVLKKRSEVLGARVGGSEWVKAELERLAVNMRYYKKMRDEFSFYEDYRKYCRLKGIEVDETEMRRMWAE